VAIVRGPERRSGPVPIPGAGQLRIFRQQRAHSRGIAFADGVEKLCGAVRQHLSKQVIN
jgi:hypothetical protein